MIEDLGFKIEVDYQQPVHWEKPPASSSATRTPQRTALVRLGVLCSLISGPVLNNMPLCGEPLVVPLCPSGHYLFRI